MEKEGKETEQDGKKRREGRTVEKNGKKESKTKEDKMRRMWKNCEKQGNREKVGIRKRKAERKRQDMEKQINR